MLIQLQNIIKNYDQEPLFDSLNFKINAGEKIGLIGNNGAGKTTLFKLILGLEKIESGTCSRQKNCSIGYLKQVPDKSTENVFTYLRNSFGQLNQLQKYLTELEERMSAEPENLDTLLMKYGEKQEAFQAAGGYELDSQIERITNGLAITHLLNVSMENLSGGEQVIVELAKLLIQKHDLLLLDEPTNHLDAERMRWLESYLTHLPAAYVIISHDRFFLDKTVSKIAELEEGHLTIFSGNYSFYKSEKEKLLEQLHKNYIEQQKEIQRLSLSIRRFRQWGHESDNEKFFKKAKQLERRLEKIKKIPKPKEESKLNDSFKGVERSGKEVVVFKELTKKFQENILFQQAGFTLFWQERTAIIGKNGTGKSTLLKLILEEETPTTGEIKIGSQVKIGYLPQTIQFEVPKRTVLQEFRSHVPAEEEQSRRILAKYGFYKDEIMRQVRFLSGGEKVRLELAKMMQKQINFLLLDEPTNHLDIETREEIEEILADFKGTLLVISHDRYFLEKMFQQFLLLENQQIVKKQGNYLDMTTDS